jgi:hypothetical protein
VQPPNLLVGGVDCLSKSIHHISIHLTTLAIRLSYISAAIFWNLDVSPASSSETPTWPNLRILDINTGLERSIGDYWLRSAAGYPHQPRSTTQTSRIPTQKMLTPKRTEKQDRGLRDGSERVPSPISSTNLPSASLVLQPPCQSSNTLISSFNASH